MALGCYQTAIELYELKNTLVKPLFKTVYMIFHKKTPAGQGSFHCNL